MAVCDLSHHLTLLSVGYSGGILSYSVGNNIVNILKLAPLHKSSTCFTDRFFVGVDAFVLTAIVMKSYLALNRFFPERAFHYQSS